MPVSVAITAPEHTYDGETITVAARHRYELSNPGAEPRDVEITAELRDAHGHAARRTERLTLPPGGAASGELETSFTCFYASTGEVALTATTELSDGSEARAEAAATLAVRETPDGC